MDETLLFRNTMRVTDLVGFTEAVRVAVDFAEQHGPQLLVQTFIDTDRMLAHSYQLYRDSAAVQLHWKLADPYIAKVMEFCEVERFEVYGDPSPEVRAGLAQLGDALIGPLPRIAGFLR